MVYTRKRLRKKRYVRRRGRRSNYRTMSRIAQRVVNKNIEMKEIIYPYTAVGIDPITGTAPSFTSVGYNSSSVIAQLCRGILQGTADNQRIGNKITLKGVYLNFMCTCASATEPNVLRFMIVRPKGQYSNTSTSALAFQILSSQTTGSTECLQPIDTDAFTVYADITKFMKPFATYDANYLQYYKIKKFIKFPKGLSMQWSQANSQPDRDLFLMAISDSGILPNAGAVLGFVKLYYKDA